MTEKGSVWYTSAELAHEGQLRSDCEGERAVVSTTVDWWPTRSCLFPSHSLEVSSCGAYIIGAVWIRHVW